MRTELDMILFQSSDISKLRYSINWFFPLRRALWMSVLKEKMESLWPKKLNHWRNLKFDPGFRLIGEYLSQYRVNLNKIFSNDSESRVEFQFHQWLDFLGQNDSIFSFIVYRTQSLLGTTLSAPIRDILKYEHKLKNKNSWKQFISSISSSTQDWFIT